MKHEVMKRKHIQRVLQGMIWKQDAEATTIRKEGAEARGEQGSFHDCFTYKTRNLILNVCVYIGTEKKH